MGTNVEECMKALRSVSDDEWASMSDFESAQYISSVLGFGRVATLTAIQNVHKSCDKLAQLNLEGLPLTGITKSATKLNMRTESAVEFILPNADGVSSCLTHWSFAVLRGCGMCFIVDPLSKEKLYSFDTLKDRLIKANPNCNFQYLWWYGAFEECGEESKLKENIKGGRDFERICSMSYCRPLQ